MFILILTIIFCIFLIVYSTKKIYNERTNNENSASYNYEKENIRRIIDNQERRSYSSIYNSHFDYMEVYREAYSIVTKTKQYFGKEALKVIEYCNKDIDIAVSFRNLYLRDGEEPPSFPAFKILALMHEHRQEYEKAIEVCRIAIELNFADDNTKGGMLGRKQRLEKKLKSSTEKLTK